LKIYYTYGDEKIPQVSISSSQDKDGKIHISICNLNPSQSVDVDFEIRGTAVQKVKGQIVTDQEMNARNTFEDSNRIKVEVFNDAKIENNHAVCKIPSKSVVVLEIE